MDRPKLTRKAEVRCADVHSVRCDVALRASSNEALTDRVRARQALARAHAAVAGVVRDADVAMYRAKAQGGACHAIFDEAMHERVMERRELETGLRHALERGQLRVLYSP